MSEGMDTTMAGYSYTNPTSKVVRGCAADNHLLTKLGYRRLEDFARDVALRSAEYTVNEVMAEGSDAEINRSNIQMTTRTA